MILGSDSETLARYVLHWLPIDERVKFKILTLVHKGPNDQTPLYPQQLTKYQHSERATISSAKSIFNIPNSKRKKILDRSVICKVWTKVKE